MLPVLALLALGGPAAAQPNHVSLVLASAAVCAPAESSGVVRFDEIAARAAQSGWVELSRRDALKLQAIADNKAMVRAWSAGDPAAPTYLLIQTSQTPPPRRLTCEVIFDEPDTTAVQAALANPAGGDPLDAPTLQGPLPKGGRFIEWAAPERSGWKLLNYSVPLPPKRGPMLSRIRYSGVEQ